MGVDVGVRGATGSSAAGLSGVVIASGTSTATRRPPWTDSVRSTRNP